MKKVLESAIANAEHNDGADIDDLKVAKIFVDEGPSMKRVMPRAKGRADRILKRTSHIYCGCVRSLISRGIAMGQKVHPHGIRLGIV